jgi:nucleotidyltransferase/DNA polymerase involved in DNA repair
MTDRLAPDRSLWPEPAPGPRGVDEPLRWVVYVDLDAYYVSCEVRDRPELAGRPVIVGPPPSDRPSRGVVLSASYEARAFGVHSALPVRQAATLCPDAVWIPPDFPKYEKVSREVRALLEHHSPDVVPFSIDEAAVGIDAATPEEARAAAERIQRDLQATLGLPASLGVATTRLVAKIATDRAKPGRIVVVAPGDVASFVAPLPVRAIPGVGPKTEAILRSHGISSIADLAGHRPSEVGQWIGGFGRELVALARGEPREAPVVAGGPRSRSTDHTFPIDVDGWEEIERTVGALAADLAASLEREGIRYGAVGVAFRWADFTRSQRIRSLSAAREGSAPLTERALRLARELWDAERAGRNRPVRTVSVRTERLSGRLQRQALLDDFGEPTHLRG